jgi:hypothetical protein
VVAAVAVSHVAVSRVAVSGGAAGHQGAAAASHKKILRLLCVKRIQVFVVNCFGKIHFLLIIMCDIELKS